MPTSGLSRSSHSLTERVNLTISLLMKAKERNSKTTNLFFVEVVLCKISVIDVFFLNGNNTRFHPYM